MTSLSAMTVGEALSSLRDLILIIGLPLLGWKARVLVQPLIDFFKSANLFIKRANVHMDYVEEGMSTLLDNHMKHIQEDARSIKEALVPKKDEGPSVG